MWSFELAVMMVMVGVNGVFAGYEIALASVSLVRLQRLVQEKRRGAEVAVYMKQNMEASLAVVQLGITLAGVIAAAVGGAGAVEDLAPALVAQWTVSTGMAEFLAIVLVVVPLTGITIVFGELIPKVFALRDAESVCLTLSPLMRWFSFSVWPVVWLLETAVTSVIAWSERRLGHGADLKHRATDLQELRATAALARASRLIGHREEGIILGAAEIASRPVREIMLPVDDVSVLNANATLAENLIAAHLDMHTRFPVVQQPGDPQSIVGYVNVKDIIATLHVNPGASTVRPIIRPIPSFAENQPIADCLERLLREHTHIALVRDGDNRILGMISLEDIVEELLGEIEDEYDRLPIHIIAAGDAWVVGGGASLHRLRATTGIELNTAPPAGDAETLSDWVIRHLNQDVRGGDVVDHDSARVAIRKMRRKKVQEAHVSRRSPTDRAS